MGNNNNLIMRFKKYGDCMLPENFDAALYQKWLADKSVSLDYPNWIVFQDNPNMDISSPLGWGASWTGWEK